MPDRFSLVFLTASLLLSAGCERQGAEPPSPSPAASTEAPTGTVTVEIEFAEGVESYDVDGVAAGTTVEAVMRSLDEPEVVITGTGMNAFVHQIGDVATGGGEGWVYTIDGERAEKGIGSTTVDPPATLHWEFGGGMFTVE